MRKYITEFIGTFFLVYIIGRRGSAFQQSRITHRCDNAHDEEAGQAAT